MGIPREKTVQNAERERGRGSIVNICTLYYRLMSVYIKIKFFLYIFHMFIYLFRGGRAVG